MYTLYLLILGLFKYVANTSLYSVSS